MAEIESGAEHDQTNDPLGRRVGVMVAIIGIILAVVTIASHRAHTATVVQDQKRMISGPSSRRRRSASICSTMGAGLATALGGERENRCVIWLRATSATAIATKKMPTPSRPMRAPRKRRARSKSAARCGSMWGKGFSNSGSCSRHSTFYRSGASFHLFGAVAALAGIAVGVAGFMI